MNFFKENVLLKMNSIIKFYYNLQKDMNYINNRMKKKLNISLDSNLIKTNFNKIINNSEKY